ncbi:dethiobiotin synthase [Pedobacter heparinus]|uniref:ATP-dependent dethiobiotin synthetase BioD n=1 Tax=Pedobacter heparinus (strain ATCC 13125 / DSM 2366 / CIP 104194 / JCM 7457 / NBRC 12017 / NCIMB 9290 / NRRL B-14731 / HIM 762-3) TaxID=485917 RepID=C6XW39_PEDHD|nr:dethiobiotin synthase [Pedobacter heparinus]ACU04118.1 dethiobiotin synthase [Pedobacter heparinus DSM 2366]
MNNNTYFITGIGTGIGKTVVSAILTEKLQADYWKPIQSGDLEISDSLFIKHLVSNPKTIVHPEKYRLGQPLSPHLSARIDGVQISIEAIRPPATDNNLVIEGAGGLMVPLNDNELILDLIKALNAKVIVVSQNYLGSINHTLLTLEVFKAHSINVEGLIFNGTPNPETEAYISQYSKVKVLGKIPKMSIVDRESILRAGKYINL